MTHLRIATVARAIVPTLAALGLAALLSGCVAYPAYPDYGYGYYGYPAGAYVSVGGDWGWGGDWHGHWHH